MLMSEPAQGAIEMELGNYARNRPVNGMPIRGPAKVFPDSATVKATSGLVAAA
jgi:hypothetical protein